MNYAAPKFSFARQGMLVLTFCCLALPVHAVSQPQDFQSVFAPLLTTRRFAQVSISPDGRHVLWIESKAKNGESYAYTVFVKALDSSTSAKLVGSGDPRAVLGTSSAAWSPDSKQFVYVRQTTGEGSELWLASAEGGNSRVLASWKSAVNTPQWSPDGRTIAVLSTEEDAPPVEKAPVRILGKTFTHQRLELVDVASGTIRTLTPPDLFIYEYDWAPDGKQMAMTAAPCCTGSAGTGEDNWWTAQLYRLDVDSGQTTSILKPQWQVAAPKWSPDGKQIAYIGGLMSDFIAPGGDVFVISPDGGEPRDVTPGLKASVTSLDWSAAQQILATEIVAGEAAIVRIRTDHATSETLWQSSDGPYNGGLMFGMSVARDGAAVAAARQSFERAPEVWAGPIGAWRQVSSANADLTSNIGRVESLHWTSDGDPVQGWLVYPKDFVAGRKYPMVVSVHGGPAAAALLHWPAAFDNVGVLSAFGYFVFYPNPRGSFGEGEAFTQGNVKDLGFGDLRDIEAGVRYAQQRFPIDPHRVGITGWSYGGYMAMWAITQTDMFRASVAGPGVSDWQSYYGQTEIEKWLIPYFGATVYDAPALYAKGSPVRFVKNVKAPTLFYVGNEDPVCPVPQTLQLWNALRQLGVKTRLLLYAHEGHGVSLPIDQQDVTRRTLLWFNQEMK